MYCEFYGFREKPFNITPNPRFIFLSKNHREAFAHLLYGIDNHAGFIELTGEVGTGKTTVLRTLLEQLDEKGSRTALIFNPCLSALELMRSINREFAIPWEGLNSSELLDNLNGFLLSEHSAGRTVVLVIDEAQNLEAQVLEQVRLISNLETKTDKLIQIVLAGQPELRTLLGRSELRQIAQRITVSYHLLPMDGEDTSAYVAHRLEIAGDWRAATFTDQAMKRVFRYSGGVPRLINLVCDRALLFGYVGESREISGTMVKSAIAEIRREEQPGWISRRRKGLPLLLVGLAAAGLFAFVGGKMPGSSLLKGSWSGEGSREAAVPGRSTESLVKELTDHQETATPRVPFDALAKLWDVAPLPAGASPRAFGDLSAAAAERGLELARHNGSLGLLARTGYPALLELTLPGVAGKRYLALTGIAGGRFLIAPPLGERTSLSSVELESIWSGTAYLPWKNFYGIPPLLAPGRSGAAAQQLQQLLTEAHVYSGEITGVVDRDTVEAIRTFQSAHGISSDGKAGAQTLLFLYQGGEQSIPRLTNQEGK